MSQPVSNIDFDNPDEYEIIITPDERTTSLSRLKVTAMYADACDLALMLCKQNNCDGVVVHANGNDGVLAAFKRATWARYGNGAGQSILDKEDE